MNPVKYLFAALFFGTVTLAAFAQDVVTGASAQEERPHRRRPPRPTYEQQVALQAMDTAGVVTMTREKGLYVINTAKLGFDLKGYRGPTPLEVRIKKNKIVSVTALPNHETPKYFSAVRQKLLPQYEGRRVTDVLAEDVDGVTGATYSSKAVQENLKRALNYYKKNK